MVGSGHQQVEHATIWETQLLDAPLRYERLDSFRHEDSWKIMSFMMNLFDKNAGLSQVMDCNIHGSGQCGDVEHKIWELVKAVLGSAILSQSLLSCKFMERWTSNSKERSSLRPGKRPSHKASLNLPSSPQNVSREGDMLNWLSNKVTTKLVAGK